MNNQYSRYPCWKNQLNSNHSCCLLGILIFMFQNIIIHSYVLLPQHNNLSMYSEFEVETRRLSLVPTEVKLTGSDVATGHQFGNDISISANCLIIGAHKGNVLEAGNY